MSKFHISNDGIVRRCRAKTQESCRATSSIKEHFDNEKDAIEAYEKHMENEDFSNNLSKVSPEKVSNVINPVDAPDEKSAVNSYDYARISLDKGHMHNGADVGGPLELYYYSSPAGRLELNRRIIQDRRLGDSKDKKGDYEKIRDAIDDENFKKVSISFNEDAWAEASEKGKRQLYTNSEQELIDFNRPERSESVFKEAYLIDVSNEWLKRCSAEEQEAISFSTSNGFEIYNAYSTGEITDETYIAIKPFVIKDIEELEKREYKENMPYEEFKKQRQEIYRNAINNSPAKKFFESVKKAPRFEKPVEIYRGSNFREVAEIVGLDKDIDQKDLVSKIISGKFNKTNISDKSHLKVIPKSSSIHPHVANSFGKPDWDNEDSEMIGLSPILRIKQKTALSPVNVSSWGSREGEIFTNPNSNYVIDKAHIQDRELIIDLIEEPEED